MESEKSKLVTLADDLKPLLSVLDEEDTQRIVKLKDEISDSWRKKQVYRTDTEMRVSVLNDSKFPTRASKYWQTVRELSSMFESLVSDSFQVRRLLVREKILNRKIEEAKENNQDLKLELLYISMDELKFSMINIQNSIHHRLKEIDLWVKIKNELDDGSFDNQDVNTHQAESYKQYYQNRVKTLGPSSQTGEIMNAVGPLTSLQKLKTQEGKLLSFKDKENKLLDE